MNREKIIAQIKKKQNSSENLKRLKKECTIEVHPEFQSGNTTSILAFVAEDKNTTYHLLLYVIKLI